MAEDPFDFRPRAVPPGPAGSSDLFGSRPDPRSPEPIGPNTPGGTATAASPTSALQAVGPPAPPLVAAILLVLVGLGFGVIAQDNAPVIPILGWVCAGPFALAAIAAFGAADAERRTQPVYRVQPAIGVVRVLVLLAAAGGVVLNALAFADWAARR